MKVYLSTTDNRGRRFQVEDSLEAKDGLYVWAFGRGVHISKRDAQKLARALAEHYGTDDPQAETPVYEAGTALVVTEDRPCPRYAAAPADLRAGEAVTVVDAPDEDGDYRVRDVNGREWYVPADALAPLVELDAPDGESKPLSRDEAVRALQEAIRGTTWVLTQ